MVANNQGISHLARRAGAQPLCRNRKAHMSVAIDRFRADPGTMRVCTRCAAALAKLEELDSKRQFKRGWQARLMGQGRICGYDAAHREAFDAGWDKADSQMVRLVTETEDAALERPGGCGAAREALRAAVNRALANGSPAIVERRRTREFEHYPGCRGDVANCSGCALTDERQDAPNYAAWPLVYLENGRAIPSKWRAAFAYQQASENAAYADNIRAAIARYGVRWSDEA